jgi:hypothetical protein
MRGQLRRDTTSAKVVEASSMPVGTSYQPDVDDQARHRGRSRIGEEFRCPRFQQSKGDDDCAQKLSALDQSISTPFGQEEG